MDPADYVLQDFSRDEMNSLSEILDHASDAVMSFVIDGLDNAMNKFNGEIKV
jgi:peptidyl-tRNA hydrolase